MSKDTKIKDTKRVLIGDFTNNITSREELNKYFYGAVSDEGVILRSREYIPLLADEACVEPCKLLYDMGLRTMASGANVDGREHEQATGFIEIDYSSMSDENKQIVEELIRRKIIDGVKRNRNGETFDVTIQTPITSEMTVGQVEAKLMELASLFQPQDVLYGRKTIEDIMQDDYIDNGDGTYYCAWLHGNITHDEMMEMLEEDLQKLFYDGEKYYYVTEELLNIHLNYVNRDKKSK